MLARVLCALAVILVVVEMPFGPWRLGIIPDRLYYPAVLVVALATWPVFAELLRARRDGQRRFVERARTLQAAVDSPLLAVEATPDHRRDLHPTNADADTRRMDP